MAEKSTSITDLGPSNVEKDPPPVYDGPAHPIDSPRVSSEDSNEDPVEMGEQPVVHPDDLPLAQHPTVAILIPFPPLLYQPENKDGKIPPFMIYAPMAAPLPPLEEGEKDSLVNKAIRKWQKEEKEAREKKTGFKAKAVGLISKGMAATKNSRIEFLVRTPNKKKLKELRFAYPASWPANNVREEFTTLVKSAKKGAIVNGVIATSLAPFALAFDTLTLIPGPFEITAVWSASSWTGAMRATGIANRIASSDSTLPISFTPDPALEALQFRMHEICFAKAPRGTVASPAWQGEGRPKRGPELAEVVLCTLEAFGEDMSDVQMDRSIVVQDLERCMKKAVKEWVKALK